MRGPDLVPKLCLGTPTAKLCFVFLIRKSDLMAIYNVPAGEQVLWAADWDPWPTTPRKCRANLNAVIREGLSEPPTLTLWHLIDSIHALALVIEEPVILSSCREYVAMPARQGATLAVEIRPVITEHSWKYKRAPAFADAICKFRRERAERAGS